MRALPLIIPIFFACNESAQPPIKPAEPSVLPASSTLADPLALVPASSDLVLRIDFAPLRTSALWAKYDGTLLDLVLPGFAGCDYNPLNDIATVTVGLSMGDDQGVFILRGLDRDKTLACLRASKAETDTSVRFDGDFVTLTNKSGAVNMFTFADRTTMVMQGSKNPTKEGLIKALRAGAPLRNHAGYLAVEKKAASDAALSIIARPDSTRLATALRAKAGVPVRYMYFTVHITDKVALRTTVVLTSAKDAAALVDATRAQFSDSKDYVERLDVRADGETVTVDIVVTEAQLNAIVTMVKAMMERAGD